MYQALIIRCVSANLYRDTEFLLKIVCIFFNIKGTLRYCQSWKLKVQDCCSKTSWKKSLMV